MANKKMFLIFSLVLLLIGCTSSRKQELNETETLKAKELLSYIKLLNDSSPDTISAAFTADGNAGEKKFRVEGKAAFDKKGYYKITILDYVFQSPVIEAYRELDRLYFYYPMEKKLLSDDVNTIDLFNYTGFKTDYKVLYTLLTGGIPLIEDYSVYKCLYDDKENGFFLILENDNYFENIFFKNNLPEKILLIHKLSRNKSEIYLKSIMTKGSSVFFKKYKIVIPEINTTINISFSKPLLNTPVSIDRLNQEKLPEKTEIIKVN